MKPILRRTLVNSAPSGVSQFGAGKPNAAGLHRTECPREAQERRLSSARWPHNDRDLSGIKIDIDVVEYLFRQRPRAVGMVQPGN